MKVLHAALVAAQWHTTQRRKGKAQEPYVNHLVEVAYLVAACGASEDVICAALLHDAIEDQGVTAATIAGMFGADVAAMVCEVTDDKTLPKAERRALQVVRAPHLTPGAKLVKLADKISNVRSIASSPPADWPPRRRLEYVEFCCKVVAGLRGIDAALEKTFDSAAREALDASQSEATS
ncbi:MAG: HD domain-containing protein [Bradyrhizobiaceae bacterium]|nr:HD domain-containing protein [Bradyrhizobiaceae bacterium]